jgi:hypothetical protein
MKRNYCEISVILSPFLSSLSLIILFSLVFLPLELNAQSANTNFSGSWTFNQTNSKLEEGRNFRAASQMTIVQDGNNLSVDRVRTNQNGETNTSTEKYTLDGKESLNASQRGPSKAIVSWANDKKALNFAITRTIERDGQTSERKSTEVWTLNDAKTLAIESISSTPNGERKATLVYDKK